MTIDIVKLAVILGSLTTIFAFATAVLRFTQKQIKKQIDEDLRLIKTTIDHEVTEIRGTLDDQLREINGILEKHATVIDISTEERRILFDATSTILNWIVKSHDDCTACNRAKQDMDEFILRRSHNISGA